MFRPCQPTQLTADNANDKCVVDLKSDAAKK
jgi:hypothetical protein